MAKVYGTTKTTSPSKQSEKFIETARKLGADEDEQGFADKLRKIAKAKPMPKPKPAKARTKNDRSGEN